MKPARFEYHAPDGIDEALALRARLVGDCAILAGGQSLMPMLNLRLSRPEHVVDVMRIEGLAEIDEVGGWVHIGATVRQRVAEQSSVVLTRVPLVRDALAFAGHPSIRNRGTIGGSLAHADPAAELPAVVCALGGLLVLRSEGGERVLPARDFFLGPFMTALEPNELLVETRLPSHDNAGYAFEEVSRRRGDFALVAIAALVRLEEDGSINEATVAASGIGGRPALASFDELGLAGIMPSEETLREAAERFAAVLDPHSDAHTTAAYRRRVAKVLVRRALTRGVERAPRGPTE